MLSPAATKDKEKESRAAANSGHESRGGISAQAPPVANPAAGGDTDQSKGEKQKERTLTYPGKDTRIALSESLDSVDSEDEEYHVHGKETHQKLREKADDVKRRKTTMNILPAALDIAYMVDGKTSQIVIDIDKMWNSGGQQDYVGNKGEPAPNLTEEIKGFVGSTNAAKGTEKKFNAQAHAHSEVAMAVDPKLESIVREKCQKGLAGLPNDAKLLKAVVRTHSSHNSVCVQGVCRPALEEIKNIVSKVMQEPGLLPENVRLSKNFATELAVTSDRPFMNLQGNQPHKDLAAGNTDNLGEPKPREAGEERVIEVVNNQDRGLNNGDKKSKSRKVNEEAVETKKRAKK